MSLKPRGRPIGHRSLHRASILLSAVLCLCAMRTEAQAPTTTLDYSRIPSQWRYHIERIVAAEQQPDALARCIAHPPPLKSMWPDGLAKAYCEQIHDDSTPKLAAIEAALKAGQAGDLDARFAGMVAAIARDPFQRDRTIFSYRSVESADGRGLTAAQEWLKRTPDSPYALAARGFAYLGLAEKARGTGWARNMSDAQMRGMRENLKLAVSDLSTVASRQPKMISTYVGLMNAAQLDGDFREQGAAAVQSALEIAPRNCTVYLALSYSAQPKWGGSIKQLRAIARLANLHVRDNPLLARVRSYPVGYAAYERMRGSDDATRQRLLPVLERAFRLGPDVSYAERIARTTWRKEPAASLAYWSQVARFDPGEIDAWINRGFSWTRVFGAAGADLGISDLRHALSLDGDNRDAHIDLANAYALKREPARAEEQLQAVIKLDAGNARNLQADRRMLAGIVTFGHRDPVRALQLVNGLLQEDAGWTFGLYLKAVALWESGNRSKSFDTLTLFVDKADASDPSLRPYVEAARKLIAQISAPIERGPQRQAKPEQRKRSAGTR
ncbi:hypothetical protein G7Y82_19680 [Solimonas sp. C16B3]|uniref:DUF4034 domain-containing protein n=2 Tax=Solimonas marina TaxID=2714601 RepID=A0A969WDE9_9GAMM|nr:hypothetical protein [Solimonas marina]